jgi:hypothetical protein
MFARGNGIASASQIEKQTIERYISWLLKRPARCGSTTVKYTSAKALYGFTKTILMEIARTGEVKSNIFPVNPFPGADRAYVGATALDKAELTRVMRALGSDLDAIRMGTWAGSPIDTLTVYFLLVAVRTGRNMTPLLEMTLDSLGTHPLRENMGLLKLYKRRGNRIHQQGFHTQEISKSHGVASKDVVTLIREVTDLTSPLRPLLTADLATALWIYRKDSGSDVKHYDSRAMYAGTKRFCNRHGLTSRSSAGQAITVSRFRKTFAMNMWHLTGGNLARTAELVGNDPSVTDTHYLSVTPEMERNHKFVGHILVATVTGNAATPEFITSLSIQLGVSETAATEIVSGRSNTGVGRCSDYLNGRFAPRNGVDVCTHFLHCFRCPNQVVMESDLHRLFSFYWLLLKERTLLGRNQWKKVYSWVIRVIDGEISSRFDRSRIDQAKQEARDHPHPMWCDRAMLVGERP